MPPQPASNRKTYAVICTLLGWFAVVSQFYLVMEMRVMSIPETIIRFFSYFTVLSNIMVAMCFTGWLLDSESSLHRFFAKPVTQTAVTVYAIVVGTVYNLVLRFIWNPEGFQRLVDELLHSIMPLLMVMFWLVFVPKQGLKWKDCFYFMAFPLCYTGFIVIRGALSGFYPYPFINIPDIGYPGALLNGVILMLLFMGSSLFLIAAAKILGRKRSGQS